MNKNVLLIGGGGHCKSVLDSVLGLGEYSKIAIIDQKEKLGDYTMGTQVIGCDDDLVKLFHEGYTHAFITIGSIGNPKLRRELFHKIKEIGFIIPTIIDPSAIVSKYAEIHEGVFVGKNSIVNSCALIKKGAIINSGSIIEHDSQISSFAHIAPGAVLGGEVKIGENSHVGLNSTLKQGIVIGSNTIIGMGSMVIHDIKDNQVAYGNPCKEMRENVSFYNR